MLLDTGWRFRLGDQENAFEKNFSDADWREVALPHDWSVEYPKDRNLSSGTGYVVGGTAWYRRHFTLPAGAKGKKIFLCFDGIYKNSQVWINGYYLGRRPNGYISFRYDITDFLVFGDTSANIAGCTSTYRTGLSCSSRAAASRPDTLNCSDAEGTALPFPEPALRAK